MDHMGKCCLDHTPSWDGFYSFSKTGRQSKLNVLNQNFFQRLELESLEKTSQNLVKYFAKTRYLQ